MEGQTACRDKVYCLTILLILFYLFASVPINVKSAQTKKTNGLIELQIYSITIKKILLVN